MTKICRLRAPRTELIFENERMKIGCVCACPSTVRSAKNDSGEAKTGENTEPIHVETNESLDKPIRTE